MRRTSAALYGAVFALICVIDTAYGQSLPKYEELPNFHQVSPHLYRGAQPRPGGFKKLAELGIKTVLNLRDDDERAAREAEEVKAAGLTYFNIPFGRIGRPTEEHIKQALDLILSAENQPVFVHCRRGKDRTGTLIAVYRIEHDGWTGEHAEEEAEDYGMAFWHVRMKKFIQSYYHRRLKAKGSDPEKEPEKTTR